MRAFRPPSGPISNDKPPWKARTNLAGTERATSFFAGLDEPRHCPTIPKSRKALRMRGAVVRRAGPVRRRDRRDQEAEDGGRGKL